MTRKSSIAFNASCLSKMKDFNVTGGHVHSESDSISEMVQGGHVVATNH